MAKPSTHRDDAERAWDLMGGAPRPGRRFNAWADAHPYRVAVIGFVAVVLVMATIGGLALVRGNPLAPLVPSASARP